MSSLTMRKLLAVLAVCALSGSAATAGPCGFCDRFTNFTEQAQQALDTIITERALFKTPVPLAMSGKPACGVGSLFPSLDDYAALSDRLFFRAEGLAAKEKTCRSACTISINTAEYCAYANHLTIELVWLEEASATFLVAELIFQEAEKRGVRALRALSDRTDLVAGQALNQLARQSVAVASDQPEMPEPADITLTAGELEEISLVLLALDDFAIVTPNGQLLGNTLRAAALELGRLGGDVKVALTRAAVLQPTQAATLTQRILTTASEIAWVANALRVSANMDKTAATTNINTNATAAPDTGPNAALAACFSRAELETTIAREASLMQQDILIRCGETFSCPAPQNHLPGFGGYLMMSDMADKSAFAVTQTLCQDG